MHCDVILSGQCHFHVPVELAPGETFEIPDPHQTSGTFIPLRGGLSDRSFLRGIPIAERVRVSADFRFLFFHRSDKLQFFIVSRIPRKSRENCAISLAIERTVRFHFKNQDGGHVCLRVNFQRCRFQQKENKPF